LAKLLTQSQYARTRGCTRQNIHALIKEGKLDAAVTVQGGVKWIDPEIADQFLGESQAETQRELQGVPWAEDQPNLFGLPEEVATADLEPDDGEHQTLRNAVLDKEIWTAKLKKLEYQLKSGALVPVEDVKSQAFGRARAVRDSIMNVPDRVASVLAAESDPVRVAAILDAELRQALESLEGGN
jgi:hypothetical protein